jgi:hypothetical protein
MKEQYLEETNLIPKDELLEHVAMLVLRNSTAKVPFLERWSEAGLDKMPLEIFDLNGQPLFFDFTIKKGSEIYGTARAVASRVLGTSVLAYELGPRSWSPDSALKKLTLMVKKELPRSKILGTKLVCYSYPKLGFMFDVVNEQKGKSRLIYDVAALSRIPEATEVRASTEGAYAWSFYGALTENIRAANIEKHESINSWRMAIPKRLRTDLVRARTFKPYGDRIICPFKLNVSKQLQYCTHYNSTEARSHHCFSLHGQQVNDYCAVATAQMVLCYYRYYYAQTDIAPKLGYNPGGCPADQSGGYESLSNNHLDATYDSAPTWETARDQIDLLHPFKSGISGHARACAGYSYVWWLCTKTKDRMLYIYDPWPWNADYKLGGAVYWENWDSIVHTNYVLTRLLYP